jgi:hypothetical protein
MTDTIQAFKGFNANLQCRGFQFEPGKTYTHDGNVEACKSGFHACEHPLDVFSYYPPAGNRFFAVTLGGTLARHDADSKIAAASITLGAELKIPDMVAAAVKYVFDRSKPDGETATGTRGAASSTGYGGAASSTGTRGAASSTGDYGAASSTGYCGAASSTGTRGAASSTGYCGAASSTGYCGRAMGANGNALFLVYRDPSTREIRHAWAGIVGRDGIEAGIWYTLDSDGKPVEVVE